MLGFLEDTAMERGHSCSQQHPHARPLLKLPGQPCYFTLLRTGMSALRTTAFLAAISLGWLGIAAAGEPKTDGGWKSLFNGKDLEGWHIVIRKAKSDDPNHLVQIEEGAIHMYKDAPEASAQPS